MRGYPGDRRAKRGGVGAVRVQQLFDLSGRTALVTGGGRGIGRHIAIGLAEAGADVMVASRKIDNCQAVASAIEALGRRAWALPIDLADPASIDALADAALGTVDRLHVLVNNAGVTWGAPTLEYPMKGWDRTFAVNVRGLWQLSQRVARHMADQGGGSIVHVTSISGLRGSPEEKEPAIAYNAAKGAVITLTKDMAVKLARYGIRVNSIAPGAFDTDMMDWVRGDEEKEARFFAQIPLARAGGEDDVKGVAVFLASDAAAYVTGHNLVVDGGWLVSA
jgi:NAD(P)-dependent dehydrogenase (short-subunit alcohol dehydrogenase family)